MTTAEVLVDRTAPALTLSGSATEQAKSGTNAAQYTLKYSATDGDGAGPVAGTSFGSAGTNPGQMQEPKGIAIDPSGNLWVVDRANERVMKYDSNGNFLMQFGSAGSGNGQFSDPRAIAISSNGTIWVTDMGNNNVQAFNSSGQFIRKITNASFSDPYGVATGPGDVLWVSDITSDKLFEFNENGSFIRTATKAANGSGNPGAAEMKSATGLAIDAAGNVYLVDYVENRVQKYAPNGEFLMQFGSTGTGTGNGQLESPVGIALAPSGNLLVTDSKSNRVQVFQPTGTYLRQFGSTGSGAGQLSTPVGIAMAAGNTAFVVDSGNHRVAKWTHADLDNQSGVVSTEVKVDGNLVEPKYAPGCATENCSITNKEWLLKSNAYSTGQHNVKVTATDGVGLSTSKEFTVTTDTTAPQITANSTFFTAPGGWLEQKSYNYFAGAFDAGGSGVTSLALKIDGKVVKSTEHSCPNKECSAVIGPSIDMATYKGGEHPAELIATDVAGNTAKKAWTINVDPKGTIPAPEASATIEAVEGTEPTIAYVASTDELIAPAEIAAGNNPGLEQSGAQLISTGVPTETVMTTNPSDGMTIEAPEVSIHVEPVGEAEGEQGTALKEGVAAVTPNTDPSVDTIVRPKYNGDMAFQSIRDTTSPETFSWEIDLGSRLTLGQIDSENLGVYHPDGSEAMLISAELAHDAVGKAVSTTLTLEGTNVVTLTVHHRVAGVVYPVVSGASFEVGYETVETFLPPPPPKEGEPEYEETEETAEGKIVFWHNAPIPAPGAENEVLIKTGRQPQTAEWGFKKCQTYWCPLGFWEMHFRERFLYNGREHIVGGESWHDAGNRTWKDCTKFSTTEPWSISPDTCKWIGNHAPYGYGDYFCAQNEWHVSNHVTNEYHAMTFHNYGDGFAGKKQNSDCSPP